MSLPPPVHAVVELFKGPLAGVRFADIDAEGLGNLAAEVEAATSEVQREEERLAELRHGLAQRQEALLSLAQRALAYARVYAEDDEELLEELNRIVLPRAAKPRKGAPGKASTRGAARAELGAEEPAVSASESVVALEPEEEPEVRIEPEPAEGVEEAPARSERKARKGARERRAAS